MKTYRLLPIIAALLLPLGGHAADIQRTDKGSVTVPDRVVDVSEIKPDAAVPAPPYAVFSEGMIDRIQP